ncbi:MAG: DUF4230 domain-containing protein [Sphingomonadaceae bacterium]
MADDLTTADRASGPSLARIQAVPWMIVIGLIALSAWLGWKAYFERSGEDPVASAMFAFQEQNSLTVFSSRFEVVAESVDNRGVLGVNVLRSQQTAIIPATVEYRVELSRIGRDRIVWDERSQTMQITVPPLTISRPNLDESRSRMFTDGVFVTREAAQDLSQNNSRIAEQRTMELAQSPAVMAMARTAGREAIAQNIAMALHAAGYTRAQVKVRYDGEPAPPTKP